MADVMIRHTTSHVRPRDQVDIAAQDDLSDVSRSQRRVRDWIKSTEDNMTSSGVTEIDDTLSNSQRGNSGENVPPDQDNQADCIALSPESWDRFQKVSRDEHWGEVGVATFLRCFKVIWIIVLFVIVLTAGISNKLALLTLTSSVVKKGGPDMEDPTPTMLLLALCFPYLCHLMTYGARSMFGSTHWPSLRMTLTVLFLELSHTAGICLLLFRVLPHVDMVRALVLMTSVYFTPSLLNVITRATDKLTSPCKRAVMTCVAFLAFVMQLGGVGLGTYQGFLYNETEARRLQQQVDRVASDDDRGLGVRRSAPHAQHDINLEVPLAVFLISLGFWENFIDGEFRVCGLTLSVSTWKARLSLVRQRLYIMVSIFKISLSALLTVLLVPGYTFTLTFPPDLTATLTSETGIEASLHLQRYGPLYTMLVSGVLCSYMSGMACKLCMQMLGFALPLSLVTPASVAVVMLECRYHLLHIPASTFTWVCPETAGNLTPWGNVTSWSDVTSWSNLPLMMLGVLWVSQFILTCHLWRPSCGRMEKIQKLFITPMRCAVLTEQTLMTRRRIAYKKVHLQGSDYDSTLLSEDLSGGSESTPLIYACATMWHETRKEMSQLLKSIFRMDIDRSARFIAEKYYKVKDPDYYDFEAHIFFDDAMMLNEDNLHLPNTFVSNFMNCIDDAISSVHERPTSLGEPVRTPTPYGGRLTWVLPGGTPLIVHLKDKNKIRRKKRWSQVMYMYYLLGYKILANSETRADQLANQEPNFDSVSGILRKDEAAGKRPRAKLTSSELRRRRTAAHFTRSVIFNYIPEEVQDQAENTYILALDGDVDFRPDAVRLLLDRMKKNKKVGAACGRIHPIGTGPLVWYQKFEYAIGHWLQKATEHVFGCVLCAPGCFSLFRGSALMDDNVTKTYATRSTQAAHYIQYDQGEDRWLSTLLLQQGYRIDYSAAADALTHAPETFSEFFNQRRRWGPSTLANLVDLISDWRTSVRLNDNLSTIYMVYQCMMLVSTILGPATIVLLMAGSFRVVFKISVVESYTLTLIVPSAFLLLCLYTKPSLQLKAGAGLSALYALVMTIVLVGTVGTAITGSITSPNVLFLFTVIFIFIVSGFMHPQELYCVLPGILYLIMIPAGYLVLTIYFLTNLHVVSWGTREGQPADTSSRLVNGQPETKTRQKSQRKGGILGWFGVHFIVSEMKKLVKVVRKMFHRVRKDNTESALAKSRTDELLEELIVEMRRGRIGDGLKNGREKIGVDPTGSTPTDPLNSSKKEGHVAIRIQPPSSDDSDLSDLEEQNTVLTSVDNQDEQPNENLMSADAQRRNSTQDSARLPVCSDDVMNPAWLTSEVFGEGPVTQLNQRELTFWRQAIDRYLYPLQEDDAHMKKVNADLQSLRNNVVFGFVMTSAVWVALTMQLEVLQNDLQTYLFIHIAHFNNGPQLKFQPLGLFFLASFALILITQFVGMMGHRWGTLLHTLAITHLGIGRKKSEQDKVREAILRVIELQKLRNIELEPEPDYDEPLADYNNSIINPIYSPDPGDSHDHHLHFGDHDVSYRENDFRQRGNDVRHIDDAVSLASDPRPAFSFARQPSLEFGPRPFQHAQLVRAPPEERGLNSTGTFSSGRGPLGNFTLQRAFEKRYRNAMGFGVNHMRSANPLYEDTVNSFQHDERAEADYGSGV